MHSGFRLSRNDRGGAVRPDHVALALIGFAAALTIFLLLPPFLGQDVGSVAEFTGQEAVDLFTPIIAMPLLVLAIELTGGATTRSRVVLVALIALWVAGQGIHLAANAIGDVFTEGPERDAFYATTAGALDHFLDETVSHWTWHVAWVGLLGMLLLAGIRGTGHAGRTSRGTMAIVTIAGILHGFTWFVVSDEGGTWPLVIPATIVVLLTTIALRGRDATGRVVTTFVIVGAAVTLVLYTAWIAFAGWYPASVIDRLGL